MYTEMSGWYGMIKRNCTLDDSLDPFPTSIDDPFVQELLLAVCGQPRPNVHTVIRSTRDRPECKEW